MPVRELQNGTSNVSFSYHIVANRKNETGRSVNENSNNSDLRFPDAPDALNTDTLDSKPIQKYVPKENAMLTASQAGKKR